MNAQEARDILNNNYKYKVTFAPINDLYKDKRIVESHNSLKDAKVRALALGWDVVGADIIFEDGGKQNEK